MQESQRFGILPTRWFWRSPELPRGIKYAIHGFMIAQTLVMMALVFLSDFDLEQWHMYLLAAGGFMLETLEYGLAERWLRRAIVARRHRYELRETLPT